MVTPVAKREAVARLRSAFEVSERRACSALGVDRTLVRYRSARPDDIDLRTRLRELAAQRRRFGYRRLHILMIREGLCMNHKKLRRLYREEGLQVRRRGGRKRALGTRAPIALRQGPNQRWSLDHGAAPQRSRQSLAGRLRQSQRSRNATGRGAALRGLRAPSRCFAEPTRL